MARKTIRWLYHKTAFLHRDFVADPDAPLTVIRRLTGTPNVLVQLPNGTTYILPFAQTADCCPAEQREIDGLLEAE